MRSAVVHGMRCVVVSVVVFVGVVGCARSQPVGERTVVQPASGSSEVGPVVDDGGIGGVEGGVEATAEPDGGSDGGVVEGVGSEVGAVVDDGRVAGVESGVEGTAEPDGGSDGRVVEEEVSGLGGSGGFRQPGELVGYADRPGVLVGEGAGPLRRERSRWEAVMGGVFDVCDDFEAAAAVSGEVNGPGDEMLSFVERGIAKLRAGSCDGGLSSYTHVTWDGPGPVMASPGEATEAVQQWTCLYGCGHNLGYGGMGLGYEAPHGMFAVDVAVDEVVVLWDSVALSGGKVLGLVQNRSAALFARAVTVTLHGHSWVFPLTVQPGEVAPFVLEAEPMIEQEQLSEIKVSAAMSPEPDFSRALYRYFPFTTVESFPWESYFVANDSPNVMDELADPALALNLAALDFPLSEGDWVRYYFTGVELVEPTSHLAAGVAREQIFEEMRGYVSFIDEHGKVFAVHQLTPLIIVDDGARPLTQFPSVWEDGSRIYDFTLEFFWLAGSRYDELEVETVLLIGAVDSSAMPPRDSS